MGTTSTESPTSPTHTSPSSPQKPSASSPTSCTKKHHHHHHHHDHEIPSDQQHQQDTNGTAYEDYIPVGCYGKRSSTFRVPADAITDLVKTLHLTEPRLAPAIGQLTITFLLAILNILCLVYFPWYLVPFAWVLAGITLSNFFVISHDCVHNTFTSNKTINRIIGEICMLPLAQPFAAYKQRHLKQFKHYQAIAGGVGGQKKVDDSSSSTSNKAEDETLLSDSSSDSDEDDENYDPGLAEIPPKIHHAVKWFRDTYKPKTTFNTRKSVAQSRALVFTYLALLLPTLFYFGGFQSILKYWLIPLLAYKLTYRPYYKLLTNNVNAYIPSDINIHVASYNLHQLAANIQNRYSEANTTVKDTILHYAKRINWLNVGILFGTPVISIYGVYTTELRWQTALFTFIYYFFTGLGITAGYHRLWAHRAYDASFPVKLFLLLGGSGALEGSLKWWAGGHRVHHRYTDTLKDPYNSKGGFWYAHMGWMLVHPDPKNKAYADIRDLNADPLIRIQHTYYLLFGPTMAFLFPALACYFGWNDFWGGLFYAGYARLVFVHHNTFCVNSVAHYFGEQTFDDERTPRDNWFNALLTFGEGYHNFHHEFPNDYRNGLKWYDYDPTKWIIAAFSYLGLTYNLKEFEDNAIRMGKIHMLDKHAHELKQKVIMPPSIDILPLMTYTEFRERCSKAGGKDQLTIIDGVIHDVSTFIDEHPGGKAFISSAISIDATEKFNGNTGIYRHSNAARNVLARFRIAKLAEDLDQVREEVAEHDILHNDGVRDHKVHDASINSLKQQKEAAMKREQGRHVH